ncbi:MAG: NAD-dependent epimerase/dehydratase family protein [Paracoccaceae bacterium]
MTKTVLILGASGKIGRYSAAAFRDAGWQVRLYDRSTGDITGAARGVDVIINGFSPPAYHDWARLVPALTARIIAAAQASGALVIVPGNVYNFGATPGTWSENTPQNATTRKGRIRIAMEQAFRDAGVRTIVLRAGNFIVPDRLEDVMSLVYLRSISKMKFMLPGDPEAQQAFCYVPDWARAAVMLAEMGDRLQVFEDIPFAGHAFSANQLRSALQDILKRPLKTVKFPWMIFRLASPFWELAREMMEMRYLWSTPHRLSGEKFNRLLPDFDATPLTKVIAGTLPADIHPDQPVPADIRVAPV